MEEDRKPGEDILRQKDKGETPKTLGQDEQGSKGVEDKVGHIGP